MHPRDQLSLPSDTDLLSELATARRELDRVLDDVRGYSTIHHERPWVALDDLLSDLRASATTVAVLERLVARLE